MARKNARWTDPLDTSIPEQATGIAAPTALAERATETELSDVEKLLVSGIFARLREIQRNVVDPYNADAQRVDRIIEQGHGLPEGSIGTTHQVNPETMRVTVVFTPVSSE